MAKFDKRLKAFKMRRGGMSLKEIANKLEVSKSTVSIWCQSIELTEKQQTRLAKKMFNAGHTGRIKGALKNKEGKLKRILDAQCSAKELLGEMSRRDRFILGLGLYWGEGVKADKSTTAFINSDPRAVKFMRDWFHDFLHVDDNRFNPYVFITMSHRDRQTVICNYWTKILEVPVSKVIYLKSAPKKVYENHDLYYGTVALRIRRSTDLKYLILGLLKYT
jgi:transcriptional regulator with XRE-family HTH domain